MPPPCPTSSGPHVSLKYLSKCLCGFWGFCAVCSFCSIELKNTPTSCMYRVFLDPSCMYYNTQYKIKDTQYTTFSCSVYITLI